VRTSILAGVTPCFSQNVLLITPRLLFVYVTTAILASRLDNAFVTKCVVLPEPAEAMTTRLRLDCTFDIVGEVQLFA